MRDTAHPFSALRPRSSQWNGCLLKAALVDFPEKHGDAKALAARLSWKQVKMPFREFAPVAGMLGVEMRGEARGKKKGVLTVFGAEGIDGFIEVGEPLHAHDLAEQIELPVIRF